MTNLDKNILIIYFSMLVILYCWLMCNQSSKLYNQDNCFIIFIIIFLIITLYYILQDDNKKQLKIIHWIITILYFITPCIVYNPILILSYLSFLIITLTGWFLNKKGCFLSAIEYNGKKHHIRNEFIRKYYIAEITIIYLLFYIIYKNYNILKDYKNYI